MTTERPLPETEAELFDQLQQLFGITEYDELAKPDPPWHQIRMVEIAKIKRYCKSRNYAPRTLGIAAYYCADRRIKITSVGWLSEHVKDALVEFRRVEQEQKRETAAASLQDAISQAMDLGHQDWAERLLRTPAAGASKAIEEFRREVENG